MDHTALAVVPCPRGQPPPSSLCCHLSSHRVLFAASRAAGSQRSHDQLEPGPHGDAAPCAACPSVSNRALSTRASCDSRCCQRAGRAGEFDGHTVQHQAPAEYAQPLLRALLDEMRYEPLIPAQAVYTGIRMSFVVTVASFRLPFGFDPSPHLRAFLLEAFENDAISRLADLPVTSRGWATHSTGSTAKERLSPWRWLRPLRSRPVTALT